MAADGTLCPGPRLSSYGPKERGSALGLCTRRECACLVHRMSTGATVFSNKWDPSTLSSPNNVSRKSSHETMDPTSTRHRLRLGDCNQEADSLFVVAPPNCMENRAVGIIISRSDNKASVPMFQEGMDKTSHHTSERAQLSHDSRY